MRMLIASLLRSASFSGALSKSAADALGWVLPMLWNGPHAGQVYAGFDFKPKNRYDVELIPAGGQRLRGKYGWAMRKVWGAED